MCMLVYMAWDTSLQSAATQYLPTPTPTPTPTSFTNQADRSLNLPYANELMYNNSYFTTQTW